MKRLLKNFLILRGMHWQDGIRMVKIDIKEFYMSVGARFPVTRSELFCDETEDFQRLVAKAVDWLCAKSICTVGILA